MLEPVSDHCAAARDCWGVVMKRPSTYDCYEGKRYICSGTFDDIAKLTGLSLVTVKHYASGVGGHRFQMYRWPRRERDVDDMRRYRVPECRLENGELEKP